MKSEEEIFEAVKVGKRPALPASSAPDGYSELLQKCWSSDSHDRPIVDSIHSKIVAMFESMVVPDSFPSSSSDSLAKFQDKGSSKVGDPEDLPLSTARETLSICNVGSLGELLFEEAPESASESNAGRLEETPVPAQPNITSIELTTPT